MSSETATREIKHGKKRKYGYKGEMVDPEQFKEAADTIVILEESDEDDDSSLYNDTYKEKASMSPPPKRRRGRPHKMRLQTLPRGSDVDDDMESPKSNTWTTRSRQYPMADAFQFPQIILRKPLSRETDKSPIKSKSSDIEMKVEETSSTVKDTSQESSSPQPSAVVESPTDRRFESDAGTSNDPISQEQEEILARASDNSALSSAPQTTQDNTNPIEQQVPQHPTNGNGNGVASPKPEVLIGKKHHPTEIHNERPLQTIAPHNNDVNLEKQHKDKPTTSKDKASINESPRIIEPVVLSPSGMVIPAQSSRSKSRSPPKLSNGQHHQYLNGKVGLAPANIHIPTASQPQIPHLPRLAPQGSQPHLQQHYRPPHHHLSAPPHVSSPNSQTPTPTPAPTTPNLSQLSDEHLQTIARQRMLQELKESEKADLIRRVEKVVEDIKNLREQREESERRQRDSDQKQCQNCARQPKKYLEAPDTAPPPIYPAVPQYPPFGKRYEPEHIIPVEHQAGLRHFLHDLGASFAHWRTAPQEPAFRGMMDVLNRFYGP